MAHACIPILFMLMMIPIGVFTQTFTSQPDDISVLEGEAITLLCSIGDITEPGITLSWQKDETLLAFNETIMDGSGRISISGDYSQGVYNLVFSSAAISDMGMYRCGFDSPNGTHAWTEPAKLNILHFAHHPDNTSVYENDELSLSCSVENLLPGQSMFWMRDPSEIITVDDNVLLINSQNRVSGTINDGQYTLHFSYTFVNDSGMYRCGVLTDTDRYYPSKAAEVVVMDAPDFSAEPYDIQTFENTAVVLPCVVDTHQVGNYTLAWEKDSQLFTYNEYTVSTHDNIRLIGNRENGEYNLEFVYTSLSDSGTYRCGVDSGLGVYHWSRAALLTVDAEARTSTTQHASAPSHSTAPIHETTKGMTTSERYTTKNGMQTSANSVTTDSSETRPGYSTEQLASTIAAIDETNTQTHVTEPTSNTPTLKVGKVKSSIWDDDNNIIFAILIGLALLGLVTITVVVIVVCRIVRRDYRRKKHHEEYSVQDKVIDGWRENFTNDRVYEPNNDIKMGVTNIIAFEDEEDIDSANWSAGSDGSGQEQNGSSTNLDVDDLYAKPDKSLKSKSSPSATETVKNNDNANVNQISNGEVESPTTPPAPQKSIPLKHASVILTNKTQSYLRNQHTIYEDISEDAVSNSNRTDTEASNDMSSNTTSLPLRDSVVINANTGSILLDNHQMEQDTASNHEGSRAEMYSSNISLTKL